MKLLNFAASDLRKGRSVSSVRLDTIFTMYLLHFVEKEALTRKDKKYYPVSLKVGVKSGTIGP